MPNLIKSSGGSAPETVTTYTLTSGQYPEGIYGLAGSYIDGFTTRSSVDTEDNKNKRWMVCLFAWSDRSGNAMYFQGSDNNSSWNTIASYAFGSGTYELIKTGTSTYRYYRVVYTSDTGRYSAAYAAIIDKIKD